MAALSVPLHWYFTPFTVTLKSAWFSFLLVRVCTRTARTLPASDSVHSEVWVDASRLVPMVWPDLAV